MASCLVAASCAAAAEWELVWEFETPNQLPMAIGVDGLDRPYLYVALKNGGLGVLDVSDRASTPRQVARMDINRFLRMDVTNLTQHGKLLYVALGGHFAPEGTRHAGMAIVDVSQPRQPRVLSVWRSPEKLKGGAAVATDGKFAYLAVMSTGVMTFDVSKPSDIQYLATFQPNVHFPRKNPGRVQHPNSRGLALQDDLLFVANDAGGLRVLDVKDPAKPQQIGQYINQAMAGKQQAYNNLVVAGKRAYVAIDYAGLEILDISNVREIQQIGWWNPWESHLLKNLWFNSPGHTNQLAFDRQHALVYLSAGDSELQVIDVSDAKHPQLASRFGERKNKLGVWGLAVSQDDVYLTYIKTFVPFRGTWSGVKAVARK